MLTEKLKKVKLKELRADALYIGVNMDGNAKLKNTKKVNWLIWNLPAVITCPYATEHCIELCYAIKAETQYPAVMPSRARNLATSSHDDFIVRMIYTINVELSSKRLKNKLLIVRIHESGDFYSQTYVNKWLEIARYFKGNDRVLFMAYTKSVTFFPDYNELKKELPCFRLRASVWDDSTPEYLKMVADKHYPIYTAATPTDLDEVRRQASALVCRCSDCATCLKCASNKNIVCEIH